MYGEWLMTVILTRKLIVINVLLFDLAVVTTLENMIRRSNFINL